jgi:hypothetical protein
MSEPTVAKSLSQAMNEVINSAKTANILQGEFYFIHLSVV